MERNEILAKINEIAKDVFDNDEIELTEATTAADVEEWDSLSHLSLISDIEDAFGVRFTLAEISGSKNVGELVQAVIKHTGETKIYYTKHHFWLKTDGVNAEIGLTDYAAEKLGNIVFINLPDIGANLSADGIFGDVESVKSVSDLISPVDGEVIEVNETLLDEPEKISETPLESWLIKAKVDNIPNGLMTSEEYDSFKKSL